MNFIVVTVAILYIKPQFGVVLTPISLFIIIHKDSKEFDKYNIENILEDIKKSNIEVRLNDFKEFKNYWINKYYNKQGANNERS